MLFEEGQEVFIDHRLGMLKARIERVAEEACVVFVYKLNQELAWNINHIHPIESDLENMVESKLADLMHDRKANIKEVSEATGLSRTTISNLVNGYSDGIRFSTLTKLTNYFNCQISDIINFEKRVGDYRQKSTTEEQLRWQRIGELFIEVAEQTERISNDIIETAERLKKEGR